MENNLKHHIYTVTFLSMRDSIVMEAKKISEINRFGVTTSDAIKIGRVPGISEVAARVIAPRLN